MKRKIKRIALGFLVILGLSLISYHYLTDGIFIGEDRRAETTENDLFDDNTKKIVYLEQNWDKQDSLWFYNTTQGSAWLPYDLFLNLEQADSETLFRSNTNMNRYRYLVQAESVSNPDGLPVGFAKDTYQNKDYVGFTCAACHTGQIDYKETGIRIDGAPALADMEGMLLALEQALKTTLENEEKFQRLAQKILHDQFDNEQAIKDFRDEVQAVYNMQQFYNLSNAPTHGDETVHYGYARLDAFGRIYNRVLSHITPDNKTNFNPANAPVSYPFLWDTPQSDFVQWNGIGNNNNESKGILGALGPLGRNTGEVLGVFANFDINKEENGKIEYLYSADKYNLVRLERHIKTLESPQWPEHILPPIKPDLAKRGEEVFREYRCGWCHDGGESIIPPSPKFQRDAQDRLMISQFATLPWIQTDPQMAKNALTYRGQMGVYEGTAYSKNNDTQFGAEDSLLPTLSKTVENVIGTPANDKVFIRRWLELAYTFTVTILDNKVPPTQRHNDFEVVNNGATDLLSYRARTLNGIWATAPYLHNGSVQNLYELFLPKCSDAEITAGKECRANRFTVGSRQFDPVKVGFVNKDKQTYPDLFEFDTRKPSNSNAGHEYAVGNTPIIDLDEQGKPIRNENNQLQSFTLPPISEEDRMALIEYLKTL